MRAKHTNKPRHRRGTCAGCKKVLSIKKDGTVINHAGDQKQRRPYWPACCSGVGKPPVTS